MQTIRFDRFLRNVLFLDAATCTGCGLAMVVAARPFGQRNSGSSRGPSSSIQLLPEFLTEALQLED